MKPIIVIAIMAVAGITLSTGFLGNEVELWIQQFGVGSGDIQTPIDHVTVDFFINQRTDQFGHFKNLVEKCDLTLDETVGQAIGSPIMQGKPGLVTKDSSLTCKITNEFNQIIAENTITTAEWDALNIAPFITTPGQFPAGTYSINVLKNPLDPASWPRVDEVHDVIVVVHANEYSMGDFPLP